VDAIGVDNPHRQQGVMEGVSIMDTVSDRSGERQTSILPQLSVRRGRAAVEFYRAAFGAVEDYRMGGTDGHEDVVAQLSVGNASFWVSDESPMHGSFSPESLGGATVRMLLIVEDPEAVVERATAAGATLVHPVGEEHGWRLGRIEDPFGHHWEIGKPLIAWPPAECGHAGEIQRFTGSSPPHCRSTIPLRPPDPDSLSTRTTLTLAGEGPAELR
jgi:PhnB protein